MFLPNLFRLLVLNTKQNGSALILVALCSFNIRFAKDTISYICS
jgi:hypothetical protein